MQTVFQMLSRAAARTPRAIAIVDLARRIELTYGDLLARVERVAAALVERGLRPGDRVAIIMDNSLECCLATLALHRAGAVPALFNPRSKLKEILQLIGENGMSGAFLCARLSADAAQLLPLLKAPAIVVSDSGGGPHVESFDSLLEGGASLGPYCARPEEPAFIFFTSGTTGLPKGVVLPQRAAESRVVFMATQTGFRHGPHNRVLGLMPLFHVIGFFAVFVLALAFNGRYYVVSRFDPLETLAVIDDHRITSLFVTPTHLDMLLSALESARRNLASLEIVCFGGATMSEPLSRRVAAALPGRKANIYGSTEVMNALFAVDPVDPACLVPGFYSEVRVVKIGGTTEETVEVDEEGELLVATSADATFSEYLGRPDAWHEKVRNGWFRTGDVAVVRVNGGIQILGRLDDMVISGGENIHPSEIERVLLRYPRIREVAVVGVPDDRWGQRVVACVVFDGDPVSSEELDAFFLASELADFKRPRSYFFLDELPRSAVNKVLRKPLIEAVLASTTDLCSGRNG